jgi:hypothetical protein
MIKGIELEIGAFGGLKMMDVSDQRVFDRRSLRRCGIAVGRANGIAVA